MEDQRLKPVYDFWFFETLTQYCQCFNVIMVLWDCDDGNENSKKLAVKLGFNSVESYQMHW